MARTHLKRLAPAAALTALTLGVPFAGTLTATAAAATTPAPQYTMKILNPTTAGEFADLSGINARGDIIGTGLENGAESGTGNGVFVKGGVFSYLSAPGDPGNVHSTTTPFGINGADTVVGDKQSSTDGNVLAVRWQGAGSGKVIVESNGSPVSGHARSINTHNQIVGFDDQNALDVAWTFQNGVEKLLPLLSGGANADALSINDNGQIVGLADKANGNEVAARWQNGTVKSLGALPGGGFAVASAINASGVAVGASTIDGGTLGIRHAVVYQNGTVTDLQAPGNGIGNGTAANAINSQE